jgi:hypothetical protein
MAANTTSVGAQPRPIEMQDSVTRPADTTQYADGDAISDNATTATAAGAFTLDTEMSLGGGVMFTDFTLHKSDHDETSADFDLLLFTTLPALTGWEDNGQLAITDTEMLECKGVVRFTSSDWTNAVTGDIQTVQKTISVICAAADQNVYGILVAAGTYTPASGEIFTLTAHALQG